MTPGGRDEVPEGRDPYDFADLGPPRPHGDVRFDPYRILEPLERHRVLYVVIGGVARVLQGADEVTRDVDVTPRTNDDNLIRLDRALGDLEFRDEQGLDLLITHIDTDPDLVIRGFTHSGRLNLVGFPTGTRGYDDVRRKAERLHIGEGLRPRVASPGDLVRMLEALNRATDLDRVQQLRRVVELDRGRGLALGR